MVLLIPIFVILFLYCAIWSYRKWKIYNYLIGNFSSPPRHPIKGNLHLFPDNPAGIFKIWCQLMREYGKSMVLWTPIWKPSLVISDPIDIETILSNKNTTKIKKSSNYKLYKIWLGNGLLTGEGEKWTFWRKIITPSFHFSILEGFVEVMNRQSDILVNCLKSKAGKGDVEIFEIMNTFTLDVFLETSMGLQMNAQTSNNVEYLKLVKKITHMMKIRSFHLLGRIGFIYFLTSNGKYLKQLVKSLHDYTLKAIQERREKFCRQGMPEEKSRKNFVDLLLSTIIDGKPVSDYDIRENVDTFMFAGHDTSASSISFALYELSKHADIQEKIYQELVKVFENKDRMEITHKKLNQLPYLDMVIKENFRINPPVPIIGRTLMEESVIADVKVPPGIDVLVDIYATHHDADNFPDPEVFDPERFSPDNINKIRPFSYIPFSVGLRNCIGQKFAQLVTKTAISNIIMNYRLFPSPDHKIILQGDITLKPTNGMYVKFEQRAD